MKQIGELNIQDMPLTLFVEGGEILSPIRIYNKKNIYVIISDVPLNDTLARDFALAVCEFCKRNMIKKSPHDKWHGNNQPTKRNSKNFWIGNAN